MHPSPVHSAILNEGYRASEVIERIRSLFEHREPDYVELDINDTIRDVLELTVTALRSRDVVIQTQLSAALPLALGDQVQLQQVIIDLIMNGADAMSAVADRPRILHIGSEIDSAGSVLVSVKDSEPGSMRPSGTASSSLCSQPSPPAWAWDCQFAEVSSRLTAESFGPPPQRRMAPTSGSQSCLRRADD